MKVVSAIHVYFASACICLAEVIPKVSDKCRRPTNAADTLLRSASKLGFRSRILFPRQAEKQV